MKKVLRRLYDDIHQNHLPLGILAVYGIATQFVFGTVCPFAILTGLPCPACGLTRACILLFMGELTESVKLHPAILLWVPFLTYLCIFRYLLGRRPPLAPFLTVAVCLGTLGVFVWQQSAGHPVPVPASGFWPFNLWG